MPIPSSADAIQPKPCFAAADCHGPGSASGLDSVGDEYYRHMKVDINWLLENNPCLISFRAKETKRLCLKCTFCEQYETVAVKNSRNGRCLIACGVRADDKGRLKTVIDHLKSEVHAAVLEHKEAEEHFARQSDKHPWLHCWKKHRSEKVNFLIGLCVDVYNDSMYETLAANSCPARSLAQLHAAAVSRDMDAPFVPFKPTSDQLHYRTPVFYHQMLEVVASLEMERVRMFGKDCLAYSVII